jgi:NSS family neurotransmitter:Na+ symporter
LTGVALNSREQWSSELTFILAALGSAVGLGNIWRFPYVAGENGGGAFVLLYLCFVLSMGLPALIATIIVGRRGKRSPIRCFERVARQEGLSDKWVYLGWLLVLSAFLLLSFFSVVASWTFDYLVKSVSGAFYGLDGTSATSLFNDLKSDALRLATWHGLFMGFTLFVVGRGIRGGIERAIKIMMPGLFFLLLVLTIYSLVTGDADAAVSFLFKPDASKIDGSVMLLALGQALLTLSVGGAGMLVYGAYLSDRASIPRSAAVIAGTDTLVALTTGLVIFPVVFAYGLTPGEGPGLIFVTLPIAFGQMPGGTLFGMTFFVLLLLAALTSALSMFEPVVAWLEDSGGISRRWGALLAGFVAWFIGLATVFSFNIWSDISPLGRLSKFEDMTIFRTLEYLVANVSLPIGAFLISVFAGWLITGRSRRTEYGETSALYGLWRFLVRYFVPAGVALVFVF